MRLMEQMWAPPSAEDRQGSRGRIQATIRLLISTKKRKEALVIFRSMTELTKLEPGCISCRLYQDVQEERALMLEEMWASEQDLHRHLRSDKFRTALLVVEMASEAPEIRFDVIAHSSGIETIEKVRA